MNSDEEGEELPGSIGIAGVGTSAGGSESTSQCGLGRNDVGVRHNREARGPDLGRRWDKSRVLLRSPTTNVLTAGY